jgi:4-alpha-glucanotransferase
LFGDLPIYLAPDAVDVWVHRELFQLDADGQPEAVAGVPPDYFSADGQLWGNPLYRWGEHERTHFRWWLDRLGAELELCDLVRIDHFRGLQGYWSIPSGSKASAGSWCLAPGAALLSQARRRFPGLPVVAEDLGVITPEVEALRDKFKLPGMRVLQFGFDGDPRNPHLPHNWPQHIVAYSGTHDNDTLAGWLSTLESRVRTTIADYVGTHDLQAGLIRALMASTAKLAVLPMQDLMGLGSEGRMNTPGTVTGNWAWQLDWAQVAPDLAARTRAQAALYGRV